MRSPAARFGVVAAAVAAALVAGRVLLRPPPEAPRGDDAPPAEAALAPSSPAPPLAPSTREAPSGAGPEVDPLPPRKGEAARDPATPRLALRDAQGGRVVGLEVVVLRAGRLHRPAEGPDGTWDLPAGPEPGSWLLWGRAGGPTWRAALDAVAGPGAWEEGRPVTGRVVRAADGAPFADLPVVLASDPLWSFALRREQVDLDRWVEVGAPGVPPPALVRTRTDAQGRWRARVATSPVHLAADVTTEQGAAWFLEPASTRPGAETETDLGTSRAHPAIRVQGSVRDAGTGSALEEARCSVRRGRHERGATLTFDYEPPRGSIDLWMPRGAPPAEAVPVELTASAPGYVPTTTSLLLPPHETRLEADLRLQPVATVGGEVPVRFDIHDADGEPADLPWFLEIGAPTGPGARVALAPLEREGPGVFRGAVPPGRWTLRALLPQPFPDLYAASAVIAVEAEHPPRVALEVPRGGAVSLALPSRGDDARLTVETPREGTPWWRGESLPPTRDVLAFHALPEGPRTFRLARSDGGAGPEVRVDVRKGARVAAALVAP